MSYKENAPNLEHIDPSDEPELVVSDKGERERARRLTRRLHEEMLRFEHQGLTPDEEPLVVAEMERALILIENARANVYLGRMYEDIKRRS